MTMMKERKMQNKDRYTKHKISVKNLMLGDTRVSTYRSLAMLEFLDIDFGDISKSLSERYKKDSRRCGQFCCSTKPFSAWFPSSGDLAPPALWPPFSASKLERKEQILVLSILNNSGKHATMIWIKNNNEKQGNNEDRRSLRNTQVCKKRSYGSFLYWYYMDYILRFFGVEWNEERNNSDLQIKRKKKTH